MQCPVGVRWQKQWEGLRGERMMRGVKLVWTLVVVGLVILAVWGIPLAREEYAYKRANTLESMEAFLKNYPDSRHRAEVEEQRRKQVSESNLRDDYLPSADKHPFSGYRSEATDPSKEIVRPTEPKVVVSHKAFVMSKRWHYDVIWNGERPKNSEFVLLVTTRNKKGMIDGVPLTVSFCPAEWPVRARMPSVSTYPPGSYEMDAISIGESQVNGRWDIRVEIGETESKVKLPT